MEINAIDILRSLPDFQEDITGVVPNFGGKCFDITLQSVEAATRLATAGFDYGAERKPLKLLGARTIHVSVFVAVEYPDQDIVTFLKQYGQLKSENLRRLCYNEEGYRNIERGIRVAEFTKLDRDLPRKVVTQGLEIFFKYTGQPTTCYRCGSTDHVVKNCPKQRSRFGHIRVEDRVPPEPPHPTTPAMDTSDTTSESSPSEELSASQPLYSEPASGATLSQPPSFASVTASSPEPSLSTATRELFESRKRPPPSPDKENPAPKEKRGDASTTPQSIREFLRALKKAGAERSQLMSKIPGPEYYSARAYYLQYKHGNFADLELRSAARRGLNDKETDAWEDLHGLLSQDAFAELVKISEALRQQHPGLFPNM